jgi:hypothetical protein
MMMDDFDIGIGTEGEHLALIAADFSAEAHSLGLVVRSETRPSGGVKASLEWVMPTAVALFLANRYLGTLLEEAAKDHYPLLKAAFRRLVRRTTGKEREVFLTVVTTSSAKVREAEPATLSVWVSLRDSRKAVFRFDHSLAPEALESAVEQLFHLLVAYARDAEGIHFLNRAPSLISTSAWAPVIIRFDSDQNQWRVWILDRKGDAAPWVEDP